MNIVSKLALMLLAAFVLGNKVYWLPHTNIESYVKGRVQDTTWGRFNCYVAYQISYAPASKQLSYEVTNFFDEDSVLSPPVNYETDGTESDSLIKYYDSLWGSVNMTFFGEYSRLKFDLSEVYARKMRRCISGMKNAIDTPRLKKELARIKSDRTQHLSKFTIYTYNIDENQKLAWEHSIRDSLEALSLYPSPTGVIKLK